MREGSTNHSPPVLPSHLEEVSSDATSSPLFGQRPIHNGSARHYFATDFLTLKKRFSPVYERARLQLV